MPLVTARSIVTDALELIGVSSAEEPISADMAQRGLAALNTMIDAWATDRLLSYTRPKIALPLVPGHGAYTWGEPDGTTTPDIPRATPVRLELCLLTIDTQEYPVEVLDQDDYESGIWLKNLQSSWPEYVYLEQSEPVAILHVWPVPTLPYTLQLLPWSEFAPYEHWDHALSWPNGYAEAFSYNLALRLAPRYGVEASPTVKQLAWESKNALAPINAKVGRLSLWPGTPAPVSGWAQFQSGGGPWRR